MPMNGQSFCPIEKRSFNFVTFWQIILQVGEIATEKVLFVTKEKICYIKRPYQIRQFCSLLYSEHKETDHRIASHANNGNSSITMLLMIQLSIYF